MLGNFSFGDYFKHDAIKFAWELLTTVYQLPKEKLWVTVYQEDDRAYDIWAKKSACRPSASSASATTRARATRRTTSGRWATPARAARAPIFYDHGPDVWGGPPGSPEEDGDRYIEIWNLVFMQFNRDAQGNMTRLPKQSVDTGMGLERLAAVLQHVHSNYEIDLFQNLIKAAARDRNQRPHEQLAEGDRRSHPRMLVPDRRRRDSRQRRPRLRAAPDRAPRDPPRLQARPQGRSSTSWWPTSSPRWARPIRS